MAEQLWWLLGFARRGSLRLAASTLARLANLTLGAFMLALPAWAIGAALSGRGPRWATVVALLAACAAAKAVLRYLEQLLGHLAAFKLMGELRVWVLGHLIGLAPAIVDGEGSARVQAIAHKDVDRIEVFFAHTIAPAISAVLLPLASVTVAWWLSGPVMAVVIAVAQLLGWVIPLAGVRASGQRARQLTGLRAAIAQHVSDTMRCHDDIVSLRAEKLRLEQLADLDGQLATLSRRSGRAAGLRQAATLVRLWGATLVVLLVGLAQAGAPDASVLVTSTLLVGTAPGLDTIERLAHSLPAGLEATRRLRELAASTPAVSQQPDAAIPAQPQLDARVEAVSFSYPGRTRPVLDDVSLRLAPGSIVGVCGPSGSGKSTLARLLQRWYDVDAGSVQVSGSDVRAVPLDWLRHRVVVVDQNPILFDATVAENLRLGSPQASDAELAAACQTAALTQTVSQLAQGLQTRVGSQGLRLSGGQRQRLALARALVRAGEDSLLILDEATSHQDPVTQAQLVANLRARRGPTLVIAHRLETLRSADVIVVVEAGRIVQAGTWDELSSQPGAFSALLSAEPDHS